MRSLRAASATIVTLAMTVLGGGAIGLTTSAHAEPTPNTPSSQLTRGNQQTSETVNGFTLSPTKGPANADATATITPPAPPSGVYFTRISSRSGHSLAIGSDGNTYAWGNNQDGQLGDGTTTNRNLPVRVHTPVGVRFTQISAGGGHSLAIGDDGYAYTWGNNTQGQLGNGTSGPNAPTPVKVSQGELAPGAHYTQISAGDYHNAAIASDDNAYTWGANNAGQLGNGTRGGNTSAPGKVSQGGLTPGAHYTQISAGGMHTAAIASDDNAYTWGDNYVGELGNGTSGNIQSTPGQVGAGELTPGAHYTSVSTGSNHTVAIASDDNAYTWGRNDYGQLGNGTNGSIAKTPVKVSRGELTPGAHYTQTSADGTHTVAIASDGNAYTWGDNTQGQLGNGTETTVTTPIKVRQGELAPGAHYTQISAGGAYTAAIADNGHAYTWGRNAEGQLGNGTNGAGNPPDNSADKNTPIQVRTAKYVIDTVTFDGTSVSQKTINTTTGAWDMHVPLHGAGPANVVVHYHIDALGPNGNVTNPNYYTGTVTLHYTYATAYKVKFVLGDATGHSSSALPGDQFVYSDDPQPIDWPSPDPSWEHHRFTGWADTTTNQPWDFTQPINSNKTLKATWQAWEFKLSPTSGPDTGGNPIHITPPDPTTVFAYTQISAGDQHSLAIGTDGNTYAWGNNQDGQLGDGTTTNRSQPVRVKTPAGVHFTHISVGDLHSLAIGDDGHVYSWGWNGYGQLGDGTTTDRSTPTPVKDPAGKPDTTWTTISAGAGHNLAISSDHHAYSWGNNYYGQLGDGTTTTDRSTPTPVKDPAGKPDTTWTTISAGLRHSLAISSDHHAYSWGNNYYGQLGNGTTRRTTPTPVSPASSGNPTNTWTTISAGEYHSLAIGSDHHAYSWGWNEYGQLGDGTTTNRSTPTPVKDPAGKPDTTWTTISTGAGHSLAISSDHHAYSWGNNYYGQLGNGTTTNRSTPTPVNPASSGNPTNTWTTISAGGNHGLIIGSDHHTYSWGNNSYGQLGNGTTTNRRTPGPVGIPQIIVTGIKFDQTEATPTPAWNDPTWDTTAPAHPEGRVTANIHWTLGGIAQPDYPLPYDYYTFLTLPQAGALPIQRLGGGTLLALSTLTAITYAGHQFSAKQLKVTKHTTTSAH
ncbi:hypothetical protein KIMH_04390 [Bombiscardovia apis]|uniref:RCC1-like domain-containing protein n=1 Tax=Bombiscardovia apis TaxID=2932182 RepID=A0ABN6SFM2_9BIFI|nr:hypothetical protein [Bombiscardovia apis]BDR54328.1 hypothetical protein KIMH_04390 [Bombiscardovia apis]